MTTCKVVSVTSSFFQFWAMQVPSQWPLAA